MDCSLVNLTKKRMICHFHGWWTGNPPERNVPLFRNKGLIAGLIKGKQWLIRPDHKALFEGGTWPGRVAWPAITFVVYYPISCPPFVHFQPKKCPPILLKVFQKHQLCTDQSLYSSRCWKLSSSVQRFLHAKHIPWKLKFWRSQLVTWQPLGKTWDWSR